mmetsp:Transcript_8282/g.20182  ORF Transcript_8282/g.20182 Transcript_8282/m.20182 type:complete len:254 (-) Transcript_8282:100-861(-)
MSLPSVRNSQERIAFSGTSIGTAVSLRAATVSLVKPEPNALRTSPILHGHFPPRKTGIRSGGISFSRSSCMLLFVITIFKRVRSLRTPFTAFQTPEKSVGALRTKTRFSDSGYLLWPMPNKLMSSEMQLRCKCRTPNPCRSNTNICPCRACLYLAAPSNVDCIPDSRWKCHQRLISSFVHFSRISVGRSWLIRQISTTWPVAVKPCLPHGMKGATFFTASFLISGCQLGSSHFCKGCSPTIRFTIVSRDCSRR